MTELKEMTIRELLEIADENNREATRLLDKLTHLSEYGKCNSRAAQVEDEIISRFAEKEKKIAQLEKKLGQL